MAPVFRHGVWILGALAVLLAAPASIGSAKTVGDRCVVSEDGVVLHHPSGVACNAAEQRGKERAEKTRRGEFNPLEFATEIPPGNPYIPSDPQLRVGRGPMQPVEIGTRILYRRSLTRSLYNEGMLAREIQYRGDRMEEIFPAAEGHGAARYEIRATDRLRGAVGTPDIYETQRHYVVPGASAYALEASELAVAGARRIVRQPRGSAVLAADLRRGAKWNAGIHFVAGLEFERRGEVVGVQSIDTELGRFEKCLVVRYTSRLVRRGGSPTGDGARVTSGKLVTTEWIARGLGTVRTKQKGQLQLIDPSGTPGRLVTESRSSIFQYQRLADRRDAKPVAAPDIGVTIQADLAWATGSWRLSYDPFVPLGLTLPMDVIRFRPDGKVELAKRTRVYASCPFAVYGDVLSVQCRSRRRDLYIFDLVINPDGRTLTTAMGSQYTRR